MITVLGSGVAGLTVATELAARGHSVTVVDPAGPPGSHHCSWWAGGMLAPFCEGEAADPLITQRGQEAAAWWEQAGVTLEKAGTLVVALGRDQGELDRFARRTQAHVRLDGAGVAALEPMLAGRITQALHFPTESHLTPRTALATLRDGLIARGVAFVAAATPDGPIVDARGLAARDRLTDLRGVRGEMVVLRAPDIQIARPVRLLHPRFPLYIVPRGDGVYMLGATQIEAGGRGPVRLRSVVELLNAAYALHPAFAEAEVLEFGADARPAFPDNIPRAFRRDGRIFVNGLFRHGYLMSPALARDAADLIGDLT